MKNNGKIRSVIADDEDLSRTRIRGLLKHHPEVEVVAECSDGLQTADAILKLAPDLLFLDIQMPGLTGFGVLKKLPTERIPLVIFVTAYDQYALKAFEMHALDYILKPFKRKRFDESLEWAKGQLGGKNPGALVARTLSILEEIQRKTDYVDRLAIKSNSRVLFVRTKEIDWIQAEDNYVRIHRKNESYLIRQKMSALEQELDPRQFVRIHRGAIVNIDKIQELHQMFHRDYRVVLQDGTKLPLSRSYRQKLRDALKNQF